eukprot:776694_1
MSREDITKKFQSKNALDLQIAKVDETHGTTVPSFKRPGRKKERIDYLWRHESNNLDNPTAVASATQETSVSAVPPSIQTAEPKQKPLTKSKSKPKPTAKDRQAAANTMLSAVQGATLSASDDTNDIKTVCEAVNSYYNVIVIKPETITKFEEEEVDPSMLSTNLSGDTNMLRDAFGMKVGNIWRAKEWFKSNYTGKKPCAIAIEVQIEYIGNICDVIYATSQHGEHTRDIRSRCATAVQSKTFTKCREEANASAMMEVLLNEGNTLGYLTLYDDPVDIPKVKDDDGKSAADDEDDIPKVAEEADDEGKAKESDDATKAKAKGKNKKKTKHGGARRGMNKYVVVSKPSDILDGKALGEYIKSHDINLNAWCLKFGEKELQAVSGMSELKECLVI